jgi:cob(I)alamin adenosyltransferase
MIFGTKIIWKIEIGGDIKMAKIYTKTGDDGTTGLFGSNKLRVKKYDLRVEAYGTVDELNSSIGLILANLSDLNYYIATSEDLTEIQRKLFNISSQLAMDDSELSSNYKKQLSITEEDILFFENRIDNMNEELPELKEFILPMGHISATQCHMSRTICRRCERRIVELSDNVEVDKNVLKYINRLSDYLFVLSRYLNHREGFGVHTWKKH